MNAFSGVTDVAVMRRAVAGLVAAIAHVQTARHEAVTADALGDVADMHDVVQGWLDQARERLGDLVAGGDA